MVWNKTSQDVVDSIILTLQDYTKSYDDVALELGITKSTVGKYARQYLCDSLKKKRYSWWNQQLKLSNKNHMLGRVGHKHHNAREEVRVSGYLTIFVPLWWKGLIVKSGRMFIHHYEWAKFWNQTSVPKGCVIHHIDCDINNNHWTNLQLLTISEHMRLHGYLRKVQRLSQKGVENSILEAQRVQ